MFKMLRLFKKSTFTVTGIYLDDMYLIFISPILKPADVIWDVCTNDRCIRCVRRVIRIKLYMVATGLTRSIRLGYLFAELGLK